MDDYIVQVLVQMKKKYNILGEIHRLTVEIEHALSMNDQESVQMLLVMRNDEMVSADSCNRAIVLLLDSAPDHICEKIKMLMQTPDAATQNVYDKNLRDTNNMINRLLDKTIEIDRVMSIKVGGEDSYYKKSS